MLRRASIATAVFFAACSLSFGADRYYRDVDIPNPEESSALLRCFGAPAEISVIREQIILGPPATSRWTYYFEGRGGTVHRLDFYFVAGRSRWEKRDEISKEHYQRFRLLRSDVLRDAEKILGYKRTHPR